MKTKNLLKATVATLVAGAMGLAGVGSTKGVHLTRDINGIGCLLCSLCDDGSASVC